MLEDEDLEALFVIIHGLVSQVRPASCSFIAGLSTIDHVPTADRIKVYDNNDTDRPTFWCTTVLPQQGSYDA
jgi:hypothetical protein